MQSSNNSSRRLVYIGGLIVAAAVLGWFISRRHQSPGPAPDSTTPPATAQSDQTAASDAQPAAPNSELQEIPASDRPAPKLPPVIQSFSRQASLPVVR